MGNTIVTLVASPWGARWVPVTLVCIWDILMSRFARVILVSPHGCSDVPLVSYRRERNFGDILVRTADESPSPAEVGSLPCRRRRCQTCKHIIAPQTFLQGPKNAHNIHDHFICQCAWECCVLHFLSSLLLPKHRRDWKATTGTFQQAHPQYSEPIAWVSRQLRLPLSGWHHGVWLETVLWQ